MNDTNSNLRTIAGAMRRRLLIDSLFKYVMTFGGISVIVAISMIFFYLASVAYPLVKPVEVSGWQSYGVPGGWVSARFTCLPRNSAKSVRALPTRGGNF